MYTGQQYEEQGNIAQNLRKDKTYLLDQMSSFVLFHIMSHLSKAFHHNVLGEKRNTQTRIYFLQKLFFFFKHIINVRCLFREVFHTSMCI